ncbi:hypothetical protein HDU76_002366 [Blyttiomyces sp. JEL0837]|nr:hypothetical protein HDU76_002366 [Blyttiomyces sp. JEL0837]
MIDEAVTLLDRYIVLHPYNEDAALLGYAGVMNLILSKVKENDGMDAEGEKLNGYAFVHEDEHVDEARFTSHYSRNAFQLLKSANIHAKNPDDYFTLAYTTVLLESNLMEEVSTILTSAVGANPDHPNAWRYQSHHLREFEPGSLAWIKATEKLLTIDPTHHPQLYLVPLVTELERNFENEQEEGRQEISLRILNRVADHLDYKPGNEWTWIKVIDHLKWSRQISSDADAIIWQQRKTWWPYFHGINVAGSVSDGGAFIWYSFSLSHFSIFNLWFLGSARKMSMLSD